MWRPYNPNPDGIRVGDCAVRAIAMATGQDWMRTYWHLCVEGSMICDMPNANAAWGAYLREKGFRRSAIPNSCPDCYTVEDFCRDHPRGTYVLGTGSHVICCIDGDYFDSWDSGREIPTYFFERMDE